MVTVFSVIRIEFYRNSVTSRVLMLFAMSIRKCNSMRFEANIGKEEKEKKSR